MSAPDRNVAPAKGSPGNDCTKIKPGRRQSICSDKVSDLCIENTTSEIKSGNSFKYAMQYQFKKNNKFFNYNL